MGTIIFYVIFFAILAIIGLLENSVGKLQTVLIVLGLFIFSCVVATLFGFNWFKTYTGSIDTTGCRTSVSLKEGDWDTLWHKFYCSNGSCIAISTDYGHCNSIYWYNQSTNSQ